MLISVLMHVPFEGPGNIGEWAIERGHELAVTHLYDNEMPPELADTGLLALMGGPMNIYEEDKYPWLKTEKLYLKNCLNSHVPCLGVCLGAQLLADTLGAKVTRNDYKEIGWFPVINKNCGHPYLKDLPDEFTAFHWHGDTFSLPQNSLHAASSEACTNQAFAFNNILGLQFHLDYRQQDIEVMVENCGNELTKSKYVQPATTLTGNPEKTDLLRKFIFRILDNMASTV